MRPEGEGMKDGVVVVAAGRFHVNRLVRRDLSVRAQEVHAGQFGLSENKGQQCQAVFKISHS